MKTGKNGRLLTYLLAIVLCSAVWMTVAAAAESGDLDEASVQAYLEKKVSADTGSCLVDNMKLEIIGIADLVPGHQAEVFYNFEYVLRCNRGKDTKKGQGVLKAVRLRNGNWIDRETVAIISK
ncbi:MAG: hypothetical protein WBY88_00250 [Desulfosarcina sp.]